MTAVTAGAVGNIIEWYDFALYGFMASVLAGLFVPNEDRLVSLIVGRALGQCCGEQPADFVIGEDIACHGDGAART